MNRFDQTIHDLVNEEVESQVAKRLHKMKQVVKSAESTVKELHEKLRSLEMTLATEQDDSTSLADRLKRASADLARANATVRALQDQAVEETAKAGE